MFYKRLDYKSIFCKQKSLKILQLYFIFETKCF